MALNADTMDNPNIILRKLVKSDQISHLLLVPLSASAVPSLVLCDGKSLFICDFIGGNKLRATERLSINDSTILELKPLQREDGSYQLFILTNENQLFILQQQSDGKSVSMGKDSLYRPYQCIDIETPKYVYRPYQSIDIESPKLVMNDKYTLIHTVSRILNIVPTQKLNQYLTGLMYPLNRFDVIGIEFITQDQFQIVSRDSQFQYNLIIYEILSTRGKLNVRILKEYNHFKEVPRLLISLNQCSIIICDGTHLIYPPINYKLKNDSNSAKMTRVSFIKHLPSDLKFKSFQIIDDSRVILITENGEVYLESIRLTTSVQQCTLHDWQLIHLGKLSPFSKILHINENLFLNYSSASKNCFFKINPQEPYIDLLNYFHLDEFLGVESPYRDKNESDSTPVLDITKVDLINCDLFVKVQSSSYNSYLSFKYPKLINHHDKIEYKLNSISHWFDGAYILYQHKSQIKVIKFSGGNFEPVSECEYSGAIPLQCYYINGDIIIVTSSLALRKSNIIYRAPQDLSIISTLRLGDNFSVVTSDDKVHVIEGDTLKTFNEPHIFCLTSGMGGYIQGFSNGEVKMDDKVVKVSKNTIIQVLLKQEYYLLVDSELTLFKIGLDMDIREYKISQEYYQIQDCHDGFIIHNESQITYNYFQDDSLHSKVIMFSSVPQKISVFEDRLLYLWKNKFRAVKLSLDSNEIVATDLRLEETVFKSLLIRVNKKIPILLILTLKDHTNSIKMIDLQSFKIIDCFEMPNEKILDMARTDVSIYQDHDLQIDFVTDKDVELVQMELYNNGIVMSTIKDLDDGTTVNSLKLFTIGGDMRLKFHYSLYDHTNNGNVDSYKILTMKDCIITTGNFMNYFRICINDKFKPNEQEINEENFWDKSILKIVVMEGYQRSEVFQSDIIKVDDDTLLVIDIVKGLIFYKFKLAGDLKLVLSKIKFDQVVSQDIVAVSVTQGNILVLGDSVGNIYVFKFEIQKESVQLTPISIGYLNSPNVNVITPLSNDHLCLLGCLNGEVLLLSYSDINIDDIPQQRDKLMQTVSKDDPLEQDNDYPKMIDLRLVDDTTIKGVPSHKEINI